MRTSISYPFIKCTRDGKFYNADSGEEFEVKFNHGLNINGPIVYIKNGAKPLCLNAARILYEAYITEKPLPQNYSIVFLDFDENNLSIENLSLVNRNKVSKSRKKKYYTTDSFDTWLGPDSVYF